MRGDYILYVLAAICFILAAYAAFLAYVTVAVGLVILGAVFIGMGYWTRPKEITPTTLEAPAPPKPPEQPSAPPPSPPVKPLPEITNVKGIGPKRAEKLRELGIQTVADLAKSSTEELATKMKVSPKIVEKWIKEAERLIEESP